MTTSSKAQKEINNLTKQLKELQLNSNNIPYLSKNVRRLILQKMWQNYFREHREKTKNLKLFNEFKAISHNNPSYPTQNPRSVITPELALNNLLRFRILVGNNPNHIPRDYRYVRNRLEERVKHAKRGSNIRRRRHLITRHMVEDFVQNYVTQAYRKLDRGVLPNGFSDNDEIGNEDLYRAGYNLAMNKFNLRRNSIIHETNSP